MALINIAEALSSNGQKITKLYLNDSTNKLHIIDDDGNDSVCAITFTDLATIVANSQALVTTNAAVDLNTLTSTNVLGATTSILGKPDKWLTFTSGTYSYAVPGYWI